MRSTVLCVAAVFVLVLSCARAQEVPESRPAPDPEPPPLNLDKDDPLNDLSARMDGISLRLRSGESDKPVQASQGDVIDQLDAMIAALKKKSGS
jgi:hypothetical protein